VPIELPPPLPPPSIPETSLLLSEPLSPSICMKRKMAVSSSFPRSTPFEDAFPDDDVIIFANCRFFFFGENKWRSPPRHQDFAPAALAFCPARIIDLLPRLQLRFIQLAHCLSETNFLCSPTATLSERPLVLVERPSPLCSPT